MGGNALVPRNATPAAEANINHDPEAADIVLGAEWPVTMVGLDVTHQINLTGHSIDRITSASGPGAALLASALPLYRAFFETTNGDRRDLPARPVSRRLPAPTRSLRH